MKNILTATLPALALLALGGCATTGAVTSTEDDGVYYSSKDRTTAAVAPATTYGQGRNYGSATTQASTTEDANPDYQGSSAQSGTANGTDYYDDNYNSVSPSGFGQPYTGPGVSSYNYSPNWSVSPSYYGSPWGYGTGLSMGYGYGGFGGYSPFGYGYGYPAYAGFYDPFYSPFYSPWGWGSGFNIGFGYGSFGGFGRPFYGGYGYPGYAYGRGYGYGGYYGDYYGGGYGGYGRPVIYSNGSRSGSGANPVLVGPRDGRGGAVMGNRAMTAGGNASPGAVSIGDGRRGNVVAPGGTMPSSNAVPAYNAVQPANTNTPQPQMYGRGAGRNATFGGGEVVGQPAYLGAGAQPAGNATAPNNVATGRRGGFFREMFSNSGNATGAGANTNGGQSMQRRSYSQPSYEQRAMSQPAYQPQQRSFEQRSYSQPAPQRSFGGGGGNFGGGGGSFGGGGGAGGGGGRRR